MYSIPANRPVTVFHSGPLIPFPNHPGQPHRRRISTTPATLSGEFFRRPATLSGEFFRRPLFRAPTTYSEPPEADLHASGNPTGNRNLTRPHAPLFSSGLSPTRRRMTARGSLSAHFRHLSRLVRRRLGLLAPRQSSPSPASPFFFPVFGFLAIPATSDRAPPPSPRLGCCFSSSPGLSSIQIREYDHQKSDLYLCSLWISSDYLREIGWQ